MENPRLEDIAAIRYGFGHKTALMPSALAPFRASMPEKNRCTAFESWTLTLQLNTAESAMRFIRESPTYC